MRWATLLAVVAAALAVAALAASAALYLQLRAARNDLKHEKAESRAVKGLALDTADTVLAQHRTIGALVDSQRNLVGSVRILARRAAPPARARTLTAYP